MVLGVPQASQKALSDQFLGPRTASEHPFFMVQEKNFDKIFANFKNCFLKILICGSKIFKKFVLKKYRIKLLDPVEKILEHHFQHLLKNWHF